MSAPLLTVEGLSISFPDGRRHIRVVDRVGLSISTGETLAQLTHQHVFSARTLGSIRFMARENHTTLTSNALSTPIQPAQDRSLREVYANADLAMIVRAIGDKIGDRILMRVANYQIHSGQLGDLLRRQRCKQLLRRQEL